MSQVRPRSVLGNLGAFHGISWAFYEVSGYVRGVPKVFHEASGEFLGCSMVYRGVLESFRGVLEGFCGYPRGFRAKRRNKKFECHNVERDKTSKTNNVKEF